MANQGMDTEVLLLINFFRGRLFTFNQRRILRKVIIRMKLDWLINSENHK